MYYGIGGLVVVIVVLILLLRRVAPATTRVGTLGLRSDARFGPRGSGTASTRDRRWIGLR
jgi:hypothetical protein